MTSGLSSARGDLPSSPAEARSSDVRACASCTGVGRGFNGILFFGFGVAAGILLAFSGVGYFQDSASLIATVFLAAMTVILLLGLIIFALRRLVWQRLFGFAEVQIEQFATPLSQVTERAIAGEPAGRRLRRAIWWRWCWRAIRG